MNIAIVEDEPTHSRLLQQYIEDWGLHNGKPIHVFSFVSAESFLFCMEDTAFNAVFADIQMPGMNGMDMVRKLREKDEYISVVFTTGIPDYLQEGYEVQALNYLIKPISQEKVSECMSRICSQKNVHDIYVISSADGQVKVDLQEINYCEAVGHYAVLVMTDRTRIQSGSGISHLEKELGEKAFVKCHRSYLCNIENIRQIAKDTVTFDNGDSIPVSRRLYQELNRRFIDHFKKG